jgi:hypothetical protein
MQIAMEKKQKPKEHLNKRKGGEKKEGKEIKIPAFLRGLGGDGGSYPLCELTKFKIFLK